MYLPYSLLFLATLYSSVDGGKSCGEIEICSSPFENLRDLVICRVSDVMRPKSLEKVFKSLVTQYCNGKTLDEIGARMETTLMASGDLGLVSTGMALFVPFEKCIQQHGSDVTTVINSVGKAVKTALKEIFDKAIKVAAPFKGKCSDPELFNAIGQFACPYMTHEMVQKLFNTIKAEVGHSFDCFKPLDKKLLFLSLYDV